MIEECNQNKDQKKEKKSSKETIDSFFGSHDFNTDSYNQGENHNFKETEQLIDKLLDNKSSNNSVDEDLTPKVDIVENKIEKRFVENASIDKIDNNLSCSPNTKAHEKEEIFEIDQPNNTSFPEKKEQKSFENKKDNLKLNQCANNEFPQNEKPSSTKESKRKKTISFHLPKLNYKLDKSKEKNNKDLNFKKRANDTTEDQQFLDTFQEPHIKNESSNELLAVEKKDTNNKELNLENEKGDRKKKKQFIKSTKDSFHFFKKSEKKRETNQSEKECIEKKSIDLNPENQLQNERVTSDAPIDLDVIELLKITDDLLGKLPDEVIEEFSKSDDFTLYEKVMKKYEILK